MGGLAARRAQPQLTFAPRVQPQQDVKTPPASGDVVATPGNRKLGGLCAAGWGLACCWRCFILQLQLQLTSAMWCASKRNQQRFLTGNRLSSHFLHQSVRTTRQMGCAGGRG